LISAPSELASVDGGPFSISESILPRIRAWQRDLLAGEAPNSILKVFVLGNGGVGKTQMCRRLRLEGFDPSVPTTHGIRVDQIELAPGCDSQSAMDCKIWDFGGQDIYLGTHGLFLDGRAIYVIAWSLQDENTDKTVPDGVVMPHRPLTYWLEYVRSLAGSEAPVIVVQTQCDRELDTRAPVMPTDHEFERLRVITSSAKQNDGVERLRLELKSAARYSLERYGKVRLPANWLAIADELRARKEEKTMSLSNFERLCHRGNRSAISSVVLEYLHRSGQVFYRAGAFDSQVVLDLDWALEGVYAVLDRDKALPIILHQAGRFSPQLLAALVWQEFGEEERKLFLSLMEQCQICFKVGDDVFVAPALLPTQTQIADSIDHVWRGTTSDAVAHLEYAFLHEGVLRTTLCHLGNKAGVNAVYWAYGICFYDSSRQSTARISSELPDANTVGTIGRIIVETAGPQALALARYLIESIQRVNLGKPPKVIWKLGVGERQGPSEVETSTKSDEPFSAIKPGQPPRLPSERQLVYVSYAWGGESEALVDEFERRLPSSLRLVRDRRDMRPGDWISRFMTEIGRSDCVLVVLSEKYMRSVYCMRELLHLFNASLGERSVFMRKLIPLTVGNVRFSRAIERDGHVAYWVQERKKMETILGRRSLPTIGDGDRAELLAILDFEHRTSDLLAWVADTLMPKGEEMHSKGIDAAIDLALERTQGVGRRARGATGLD
jgi:internalin A